MLRLVALCVLLWFVVLRCVWLRCVLFVVVCRLALIYVLHRFVLRFVALCVVRRGLSYRVDLCVAQICVAFGRLVWPFVAVMTGRNYWWL